MCKELGVEKKEKAYTDKMYDGPRKSFAHSQNLILAIHRIRFLLSLQ